MEKKTVIINLRILKSMFISLSMAFLVVFIIEHFGKFSYNFNTTIEEVQVQTGVTATRSTYKLGDPINQLIFTSPFSSEMHLPPNGWSIYDLKYTDGNFYDYSNTAKYYFQSTLNNYVYILIIAFVFFLSFYFFEKFKIKFN